MSSESIGELLIIAIAFAGFNVLIWFCGHLPRWGEWAATGLLVLFIPAASVFLFVLTDGRAAIRETLPAMPLVAIAMGVAWSVVKKKTSWLAKRAEPTQTAGAELETPPAERVSVQRAKQRSAPTSSPQPREAPRPSAPAPANDRIFVSYRRSDSADVTGRIYDRLVQRFGKEQIFKDVDSIPLGLDFREYVGEVVGRCNLLLAVVGDQWLTANAAGTRRIDDPKDLVRIEIEAALARKIPVVPVLVRGASVPEEQELPPSLAGLTYRNGIKVRSDPDFHHDMDRLIAGIDAHLHPRA